MFTYLSVKVRFRLAYTQAFLEYNGKLFKLLLEFKAMTSGWDPHCPTASTGLTTKLLRLAYLHLVS